MPRSDVSYDAGLRRRLAAPGNALTRLGVLPRRVLVGVAAAGHLAAAVLPWPAGGALLFVAYLAMPVALVVDVVLGLATRLVADLSDRVLDERSQARRNRAAFVAFRVGSTVVVLVTVAVAAAVVQPGLTVSSGQASVAAVALTLFLAVLPTWVLAWTEPSPLADEEADPHRAAPGPLPWPRILLQGALFSAFMVSVGLLGFGGTAATPGEALRVGVLSGAVFVVLLALWSAWSRRRL